MNNPNYTTSTKIYNHATKFRFDLDNELAKPTEMYLRRMKHCYELISRYDWTEEEVAAVYKITPFEVSQLLSEYLRVFVPINN